MELYTHLNSRGVSLTVCQQQAVEASQSHVLLLAVPGAGKTTALVSRIAYLLHSGQAAAGETLNLTFNREATRDMTRRWESLFAGFLPQPPAFSTIHSFCYRILREHAARRGTQLPQLLSDGGQSRIVAGLYRERAGSRLPDDRLEALCGALGYCANMMLDASQREVLEREIPGLRGMREDYEAHKRAGHLMDFDDMLSFALKILRGHSAVADDLRRRYPYLQLDEAQDTSRLQHEIIRVLAPKHLFMVGDEDQSIYRFRGAYPRALLDFSVAYPGAQVYKMEENFRSTPQIIAPAATFIAQNHQRYNKTMIATRPAGSDIDCTVLTQASGQYDYVATRLAALQPGESAAVLYRGGVSAAAMADVLLRRGMSFATREKRYPLSRDIIVRDVISFLRLALDPGDGEAFLAVYYKLGCYLTREWAERAATGGHNIFTTLIDGEEYPGKSTARLGYLSALFCNIAKKSPIAALDKIAVDLDYLDYLQSRGEGGYTDEVAAQRLGALYSIAGGCATAADFLERLTALDGLVDKAAQEAADIILSTVHSAKGREFDRVYLIDLFEGVFPAAQAIEERAAGLEDGMEEEARLFYVAITRARNTLELVTAQKLGEMELLPSRFIGRLCGVAGQSDLTAALEEMGLRRRARVAHPVFGFGTIETVNRSSGEFTVRFPKVSIKTFALDALEEDGLLKLI